MSVAGKEIATCCVKMDALYWLPKKTGAAMSQIQKIWCIMNMGYAVKEVRQCLQMTQVELAAKCGCTQTSLSQLENGTKSASQRTINKICRSLEIPETLLYLVGLQEHDLSADRRHTYSLVHPSIKDLALLIASQRVQAAVNG